MVDHDDEPDDSETNYPAPDPFAVALQLCAIASKPATYAAALKKLRKLGRDIDAAEARLAAVQAQAAKIITKMESDVAAFDERVRAHDARETAFANSLTDARDELHVFHAHLEQTHRQLVHRIMSCSGILGEWNWDLQSPPSWGQLRKMIANLPDDLPATPSA